MGADGGKNLLKACFCLFSLLPVWCWSVNLWVLWSRLNYSLCVGVLWTWCGASSKFAPLNAVGSFLGFLGAFWCALYFVITVGGFFNGNRRGSPLAPKNITLAYGIQWCSSCKNILFNTCNKNIFIEQKKACSPNPSVGMKMERIYIYIYHICFHFFQKQKGIWKLWNQIRSRKQIWTNSSADMDKTRIINEMEIYLFTTLVFAYFAFATLNFNILLLPYFPTLSGKSESKTKT
jgi:hypothetical protein